MSQNPDSLPDEGPSNGPSTPNASSAPAAGTLMLKGPTSEPNRESSPSKRANGAGYPVSPPTFTYNVPPNMRPTSGNSQQSSPSSSALSSPSMPSLVLQSPGPSMSPSTRPFFSYIPNSGGGQQFQNSMNTSATVHHKVGVISPTPSPYPPMPVHISSGFTTRENSTLNMSPLNAYVPNSKSFSIPPGLHKIPGTPGPPGLVQSAGMRPIMPGAPVPSNPLVVMPQQYPTYHSLPTMAASPPFWLQSPLTSNLARPPFIPYPVVTPGSFAPRGIPPPSVSLSDSEPPGVNHVGNAAEPNKSYAASACQGTTSSDMEPEVPPPGLDSNKVVNDNGIKNGATIHEQLDTWTAHKTVTGVIYYYNSVTKKSTYEKPSGFKGQVDKVTTQPTPVSWEKLGSTDWTLVTTNDGKKYYHNNKTKLSSWQIPIEVTELGKKLDGEVLNEPVVPVPTNTASSEKGSVPIILSAPAANTGGRDATALRSSVMPGSSALDMIKKKLQDSGAPPSSSSVLTSTGPGGLELNDSRTLDPRDKGLPSENNKDKLKDANGDGNISDSSSDSEDADSRLTKELCIIQFKEMLKESGVAPFSKWEKELPKIVFDARFKAIPSHSARRSLFDHYVKTRAEEERKEKRAAQKAAIEGFKQLLEEASEDIDQSTNYHTFRKKWDKDPRFEAVERKDRELLLNERIRLLKRAAGEKAQARREVVALSFKSMLQEKGHITTSTRWAKVKDSLRDDNRYKSVKHEDRELLFKEYIFELEAEVEEADQGAKAKRHEQEILKERERELRKRKEREEEEMERVRFKVRRKEAISSYLALLVESIKDPQASWAESKLKLEKDLQRRATNSELHSSDIEKLFREHVKMLRERCANEFKALLAEVITTEAAAQETEDGKTVFNSWSTAKRLLKPDPRYVKMPRKESESLWRRYSDDMQRKQKSALDQNDENPIDGRSKYSSKSNKSHN